MPQYGMLEYKITLARIGLHLTCKGSTLWGYSSVGRAQHLQCWGRRFEPDYLHCHTERLEYTEYQTDNGPM